MCSCSSKGPIKNSRAKNFGGSATGTQERKKNWCRTPAAPETAAANKGGKWYDYDDSGKIRNREDEKDGGGWSNRDWQGQDEDWKAEAGDSSTSKQGTQAGGGESSSWWDTNKWTEWKSDKEVGDWCSASWKGKKWWEAAGDTKRHGEDEQDAAGTVVA